MRTSCSAAPRNRPSPCIRPTGTPLSGWKRSRPTASSAQCRTVFRAPHAHGRCSEARQHYREGGHRQNACSPSRRRLKKGKSTTRSTSPGRWFPCQTRTSATFPATSIRKSTRTCNRSMTTWPSSRTNGRQTDRNARTHRRDARDEKLQITPSLTSADGAWSRFSLSSTRPRT